MSPRFPPLSPSAPSLVSFVSSALPHSHLDVGHPHFLYTHAWPHDKRSRQTCTTTGAAGPHMGSPVSRTECKGGHGKFPPASPSAFSWHLLVVWPGAEVASLRPLPAHPTPQTPTPYCCPSSSWTLSMGHQHPYPPTTLGAVPAGSLSQRPLDPLFQTLLISPFGPLVGLLSAPLLVEMHFWAPLSFSVR